MPFGFPGSGEISVLEVVGPVVEVVAVAVDRDPVGLALPGADRGLQVAHIVVHIDLVLHPVGHYRGETLAADITLEGGAHFDDVEIDRAGGDRLLEPRVVVSLGEVDPIYLRAGVRLPRIQEAAEEEVVQVLVVEPEEGDLHAGKLALGDIGLGRPEAERADLLPVRIGGRSDSHARDLKNLCPDIALGKRRPSEAAKPTSGGGNDRTGTCRTPQHPSPAHLSSHEPIIDFYFH